MNWNRVTVLALAGVLLSATLPLPLSHAGDSTDERMQRLIESDLSDLMNMQVTSVSRREQKISEAASAIVVIGSEEIRRSTATSVPELLRGVPGVTVRHINGYKWAVSCRGFGGEFSNKLLVLVDGRTVYSPIFSGVYWDVQDLVLDDVDRIEVIRGPGATVWGANAVNGVINITTKDAANTTGLLVTGGGGPEERGFGNVRWGGTIGSKADYRAFARFANHDASRLEDGLPANDASHLMHGGFRTDWAPNETSQLTFHGDLYGGSGHETVSQAFLTAPYIGTVSDEVSLRGGNLVGSIRHDLGQSHVTFQSFVDVTRRSNDLTAERATTIDQDFQHQIRIGTRHDVVWGLGYRHVSQELKSFSFSQGFDPSRASDNLFSAFVQDDISLLGGRNLHVTVGSKIEHNARTGLELQPSARILWAPDSRQSLWGAFSRAVRVPSSLDNSVWAHRNVFADSSGLTYVPTFLGNPNLKSEVLLAQEIGYRRSVTAALDVDVTVFHNSYSRLIGMTAKGQPYFEVAYLVIPFHFTNSLHADAVGAEVSSTWNPASRFKLKAAYSWLNLKLTPDDGTLPLNGDAAEGASPHNQVSLHTYLDVSRNVELDGAFYLAERLTTQDVPGYSRVDLRLGWRPAHFLDLTLAGTNIFNDSIRESVPHDAFVTPTWTQRSIFGKVTWRY